MKLSPRFPATIKPVRVGIYQATAENIRDNAPLYFWDGNNWIFYESNFWPNGDKCFQQDKKWRGLARKP